MADEWEQFQQTARALRKAFAPYIRGYGELVKRLRSEGFRVRWTCIMVPIQLEGHLPTGEAFYFRCRNSSCSLSITPRGVDPVREPVWRDKISRWGQYEAGSLKAEEAEAVIRELFARYTLTGGRFPSQK